MTAVILPCKGYLKDFPPMVDWDEAMAMPRDKVMIIATGGAEMWPSR